MSDDLKIQRLLRDPDFWVAALSGLSIALGVDPSIAAPVIAYLGGRAVMRTGSVVAEGKRQSASFMADEVEPDESSVEAEESERDSELLELVERGYAQQGNRSTPQAILDIAEDDSLDEDDV